EATLMPGRPSCVAGCPCNLELMRRKVANSDTSKYPDRASVAYQTGEMCPLDRKNRSSPWPSMLNFGSCFSMWKYNATKNSVQPSEPPGCPDWQARTIRTISRRICVQIFFSLSRSGWAIANCLREYNGPVSALQIWPVGIARGYDFFFAEVFRAGDFFF